MSAPISGDARPDATDDPDPDDLDLPPGRLEMGMAARGDVRWIAVDLSGPVQEARARLDLSPVASAALGRGLAAAAMLLRLTEKTPVRVILEIKGDGPIRQVVAEAGADGSLRGSVGNPRVAVPDLASSKLAVGEAVGEGVLRIWRDYERGRPYYSQVELVSGEIALDVAHYLEQSQQVRSAVLLGVLARRDGVAAAGGLIGEVLPGADEESVARLESNIAASGGVSRVVEQASLDGVKELLLAGLEPVLHEERELRYHCRCDRERLRRLLGTLAEEEDEPLHEEGRPVRIRCEFCGRSYSFDPSEIGPSASVS
ncbi:MAG: Hsp33 family molecular chaperone HslO [Thermoanaerobaculia bacterium]|nr:Hsp33 family molecular chaperone HslO [Thermoanaerobaculia bacterium]